MEFVNGFVEEIPFPDGHFDIVLTRLAFHHFIRIERSFRKWAVFLNREGN